MQTNLHIGRVARDVQLQTYGDNKSRISFTLAVAREQSKEVDFLNYVAFGKTAELIAKYGSQKGTMMAVKFTMTSGTGTDKDGQKKTYQNNVVQSFKVLSEPKSNNTTSTPDNSNGFPTDADAYNTQPDDVDMTFMGPTTEAL